MRVKIRLYFSILCGKRYMILACGRLNFVCMIIMRTVHGASRQCMLWIAAIKCFAAISHSVNLRLRVPLWNSCATIKVSTAI